MGKTLTTYVTDQREITEAIAEYEARRHNLPRGTQLAVNITCSVNPETRVLIVEAQSTIVPKGTTQPPPNPKR